MSVSIQYEGPIISILLLTRPKALAKICSLNKKWNKYSCTFTFMSQYLSKWFDEKTVLANVLFWIKLRNGRVLNKWLELLCKRDLFILHEFLEKHPYDTTNWLFNLIGRWCSSPTLISYILNEVDISGTDMLEAGVAGQNETFLHQLLNMKCVQLNEIIFLACEFNKPNLVLKLLSANPGYPIDLSSALVEACANECVELSRILINDPRCDPTVRNCGCMQNAVMFHNLELIQMLAKNEKLMRTLDLDLLSRVEECLKDAEERQAKRLKIHMTETREEKLFSVQIKE